MSKLRSGEPVSETSDKKTTGASKYYRMHRSLKIQFIHGLLGAGICAVWVAAA